MDVSFFLIHVRNCDICPTFQHIKYWDEKIIKTLYLFVLKLGMWRLTYFSKIVQFNTKWQTLHLNKLFSIVSDCRKNVSIFCSKRRRSTIHFFMRQMQAIPTDEIWNLNSFQNFLLRKIHTLYVTYEVPIILVSGGSRILKKKLQHFYSFYNRS